MEDFSVADQAAELLEKADEVLQTKGWCGGFLTVPKDEPNGRRAGAHCAVGAIGYARWGEEFDKSVFAGTGYQRLAADPVTSAAMVVVANEIRAEKDIPPIDHDEWNAGDIAMGYIVEYNDSRGGGSEGKAKVRRMFKRGRKKLSTWLKDKLPKKKQEELEVEYVKAPLVVPNVGAEEVRTHKLEVK